MAGAIWDPKWDLGSDMGSGKKGHADSVRKNLPEDVRNPSCWIYAWKYRRAGICPNFFDGKCPKFAGKCPKFLLLKSSYVTP